MRTATRAFAAAVKRRRRRQGQAALRARRARPYERIEPVAESFGDLDPEIDARVNDVAKGEPWTGFHRIEQALWGEEHDRGHGDRTPTS